MVDCVALISVFVFLFCIWRVVVGLPMVGSPPFVASCLCALCVGLTLISGVVLVQCVIGREAGVMTSQTTFVSLQ